MTFEGQGSQFSCLWAAFGPGSEVSCLGDSIEDQLLCKVEMVIVILRILRTGFLLGLGTGKRIKWPSGQGCTMPLTRN